jgi:hypothetical protein
MALAGGLLPDSEVAVQQLGYGLAVDAGGQLVAFGVAPRQQLVAFGNGVVQRAAHANAQLDALAMLVTAL